MENVREIVLDVLMELEKEAVFSNRLMKSVLDKYDYLGGKEKAFIKRVTEGTIERRIELDYYLDAFSKVKVQKMKPLIRNLLRMSVYQILYMDSIPDSAVCNEACKLAGKRKFVNLKGFVNGVLRKISSQKGDLPLPDKEKAPVTFLSVKYSMPEWLVEMWQKQYGTGLADTMLQGLLQIHPVSLRFVERLDGEEIKTLVQKIEKEGVELLRSPYSDHVYLAKKLSGIRELPGYEEGLFQIQDVSSYMAVKAMGITKDQVVMDVCAAPGGKSILASELAKQVISSDLTENKAELIRENVERMGRDNVSVDVRDARIFEPAYENKADVLILDVPCSGLGILGKKRDIKYNVTKESMDTICELQKEILKACYRYVKPGGILMYSTCTVRKEENTQMVQWILKELPFEPVSVLLDIPERLREDVEKTGDLNRDPDNCCIQMFPGVMDCDGFFFAKLRRKNV